ncbi:MAG: hypothetical protein WB647_23410 [Roseiarcus sp.]|uniref:hypothetical protein n=1 Tax=Roseiarcus sp. TaxID=1969460 RepID=UPI003C399E57
MTASLKGAAVPGRHGQRIKSTLCSSSIGPMNEREAGEGGLWLKVLGCARHVSDKNIWHISNLNNNKLLCARAICY